MATTAADKTRAAASAKTQDPGEHCGDGTPLCAGGSGHDGGPSRVMASFGGGTRTTGGHGETQIALSRLHRDDSEIPRSCSEARWIVWEGVGVLATRPVYNAAPMAKQLAPTHS
ncbi:uncharacterized protein PpBr36_09970 [Pyricularia pennisetigena]|uniref:uncharacterized protein n=1 Tax=Pyricularia pennisetigena TaxID=1578925 RepID=UPI001150CFEE|nr:uncharacterized protein PpBr36_09970 [Pyricularia pennisetigena]TLS22214.1 hypothetical protein PpBr36_09970 [Pyricularia pennisetigena]